MIRIQIARNTRHQIAGTICAVKGHILPLDFVIQKIAHTVQYRL